VASATLLRSVTAMANPWTDVKYKINTYLIEYAARHQSLDTLQLWVALKAIDVERHHNATGKLLGITDVCKRIAFKARRSVKTIRRHLHKAQLHDLVFIDIDNDLIEIRSRTKATLRQRNSETNCGGEDRSLPDAHASRIGDIREISVTLPEIWDAASIGRGHAKILSIIRQKMTELGWGRASLAKVIGQAKRSTARSDVVHRARRGFQFAFVPVSSIAKVKKEEREALGKKIEAGYHKRWEYTEGNGKKLWYGKHDGQPGLFTQLNVKWDTNFRGRLRQDRDVIAKVMSSGVPALMDECRSLHPVFAEHGRDSDASRGEGILAESTRQSIWRALRAICTGEGIAFNPCPTILVVDGTTWSLRSFGTNESSNQKSPFNTKKRDLRLEEKAHRSAISL
jgi:hypothetical protein